MGRRWGIGGVLALMWTGCFSEPDYTGLLCSDGTCPEPWVCAADDRCYRDPPEFRDGGVDPDAGGTDAAPDAMPIDSGMPDSGTPDAGPVDAGDPVLARCADAFGYPTEGWEARYFALPSLPDPTFGDCLGVFDVPGASLDENWMSDAPDGVDAVDFGSQWTARRTFDQGVYTVLMQHDDGVRVYIDDTLVYDDWEQGVKAQVVFQTPYLSAGGHDIRIEHFDAEDDARLAFQLERGCTSLVPPTDDWVVTYHPYDSGQLDIDHCYGVEVLSGPPFAQNYMASAPALVTARGVVDGWGLVAQSELTFTGATDVVIAADDGARVTVGSLPPIGRWADGGFLQTTDVVYARGPQTVRLEKYDATGDAELTLLFTSQCGRVAPNPATQWSASYYGLTVIGNPATDWIIDTTDCLGGEVLTTETLEWTTVPALVAARTTGELWGAVYRGNRTFAAPTVTNLDHDDGVRIYSADILLYELWTAPLVESTTLNIPSGPHDFRVEYFENFGGQQLRWRW